MRALLWYFFVCLFLFHLKIWFDLNYKCGHLVHYHFSHGVHRYAVPLRGVGHGLPSPRTRSIECAEPPGAQRRSQSSPSSWAGGAVQSYPWCFFFCFLIKPIPLYPLSKVDCDKTWGDFFFPLNSFTDMQCNCMMGVFPEISRAWLTIDNDIFMWNYEDGWVFLTGIMIIPDWKF